MAKHCLDMSRLITDPTLTFVWPGIVSYHCNITGGDPEQFHVIYAWFGWSGFGSTYHPVPILEWTWGDPIEVTPLQRGLAAYMRLHPSAVNSSCFDCNARFNLPRVIRFNHTRFPQYDYNCPVCYGDAAYSWTWTPDQPELLILE